MITARLSLRGGGWKQSRNDPSGGVAALADGGVCVLPRPHPLPTGPVRSPLAAHADGGRRERETMRVR